MSAERLPDLSSQNLRAHGDLGERHFAASRGRRIVAAFLDGMFQGGLMALLTTGFATIAPTAIATLYAQFSVIVFYFIIPVYSSGQTLGKKIMGIKIISPGQPYLGLRQVLARELMFKTISLFAFSLGYLWFFFNKDGKAWHDSFAKTWVVEK